MGLPLHLKFTTRTDLCPHIKYLQPQGTSQWLFALRRLFIAGVNWQALPPVHNFFPDLFLSRRSQTGGGQPHRRQQNNLLSTALIICMAFHNNKRKNLDPTACQYLRHSEREILLSLHLPEQFSLMKHPSHSPPSPLPFYIPKFLA